MKSIIIGLIIILTSFSTVANASNVGLICTNQREEVPRLFKVDLANKDSYYFSYAYSKWETISTTYVSTDEIKLQRYGVNIIISRVTLEWEGHIDIDFDSSPNLHRGSCVTKKLQQMNDVAKRELDKLNNKRAF
jgi:hypothetical protein